MYSLLSKCPSTLSQNLFFLFDEAFVTFSTFLFFCFSSAQFYCIFSSLFSCLVSSLSCFNSSSHLVPARPIPSLLFFSFLFPSLPFPSLLISSLLCSFPTLLKLRYWDFVGISSNLSIIYILFFSLAQGNKRSCSSQTRSHAPHCGRLLNIMVSSNESCLWLHKNIQHANSSSDKFYICSVDVFVVVFAVAEHCDCKGSLDKPV